MMSHFRTLSQTQLHNLHSHDTQNRSGNGSCNHSTNNNKSVFTWYFVNCSKNAKHTIYKNHGRLALVQLR